MVFGTPLVAAKQGASLHISGRKPYHVNCFVSSDLAYMYLSCQSGDLDPPGPERRVRQVRNLEDLGVIPAMQTH